MKKIRKLIKLLGPGFITGASDDDPSGIATYSQTGALFGYSQLWTALFTTPLMTAVQEMCGRIGLVTGKGLAGVIKLHYPKPILYFAVVILLIANTINIGANLGAMASAGELLIGIPFVIWLIGLSLLSITLEIFVSYKTYAKYLKFLTLSLIAYICAALLIKHDWVQVIRSTFLPTITFNQQYLLNIVAILGTTISPYLFFWQTSEEVEEEVATGKLKEMDRGIPDVSKKDFRVLRIDTLIGMIFSNVIMYFIIVSAVLLYNNGIHSIQTASQAAMALRPLAGDYAYILFTAGIMGTGLLAIPILAGSASYALSEVFGWKTGLYLKFKRARGFYGIMIIATIIGIFVNFTPIKPFSLLYYTAVLNGLVAPPLLILIVLISNNSKIMKQYKNTLPSNILGITVTIIMSIAAIALLLSFI